ncbi:MAG: sensor histidine kinase [Hymenobacteraceae bacterium]|nr:sensor histidine kinase [Hymenobacteraceae bacterium]
MKNNVAVLICCAVLCFFLQLTTTNAFASAAVIDSLQQELIKANEDTQKVNLLNSLCWEYTYINPKVAQEYGSQALSLAEKLKFTYGMAVAHNRIGVLYDVTGRYTAALDEYALAIKQYKSINNLKGVASTLNNIGLVYWNIGAYDKALSYYLSSLKKFEAIGLHKGVGNAYNNIGLIYMDLKNMDKALYYQKKALQLKQALSDPHGIATSYTNLGLIYYDKKEYDKAQHFLERSLIIKEKIKDNYGIGRTLNSLGFTYIRKGMFDEGMKFLYKAVYYKKLVDDKQGLAATYQDIQTAFFEKDLIDSALVYNYKALQLAEETGAHKILYKIYNNLSIIYAQRGQYKQAFAYAQKYTASKDSVLNEQKTRQLAELATRYETEKKENEIALLNRQQQLQQLKIKHQDLLLNKRNTQIGIVIIGFLVCAVIAYLFYKQNQLRQKLVLDQEMLKQHKLRTRAVMEAEARERKRIGTELHDGLGQLLSVIKLNLTALQDEQEKLKQQSLLTNAINTVNETFKEVRQISHNMMPDVVQKKGLVAALQEYISKINETQVITIELDIVELQEKIDVTLENSLYRVIQEILTNSLKHAKATLMQVQLIKHENELILMIEDNGVGFDTQHLDKNQGIGLKNVKSRIDCLNGEMYIDSVLGRGTIITIEIPLVSEQILEEV